MTQSLDNLLGIWKCRNGQFAVIGTNVADGVTRLDRWYGYIYPDKAIQRCWDRYGNNVGAGREYDLMERKRGNETGWPEVKE